MNGAGSPISPTARPASPEAAAGPGAAVLAEVTRIWSVQLGVDAIGPDDDFFDLGGHSLHALEIIARIEEEFGLEISLGDLYAESTVRGLAQRLAEIGKAGGEPS